MISCGGCNSKWTQQTFAHCASCHHTFSGVTYFDLHRYSGKCVVMGNGFIVTIGSITLLNIDDIWSTEEGHANRAEMSARMKKARAKRGSDE